MDYKEKFISLINDKTLPIEQRKKLEEIYNSCVESEDEKLRKQIISFLKEFEYDHDRNLDFSSWIAWLEKQAEKPKKISIWKHWKDGIAGGAEGEQIFLIKIGRVYSVSSCLGCECDYIELSVLDKLMLEERQDKVKQQ